MNIVSPGSKGALLSIIEIGAYPNLTPLYEKAGYTVFIERSMRKALSQARRLKPAVIVAEFNFQSDFRDRTSSLESLQAVIQTLPDTKIIVFYDKEQAHQFDRLRQRFPVHAALTYPINTVQLDAALNSA